MKILLIIVALLFSSPVLRAQNEEGGSDPEVESAPTTNNIESGAKATATPTATAAVVKATLAPKKIVVTPSATPKSTASATATPALSPTPIATVAFDEKKLKKGLYALLDTSLGKILIKLLPDIAPLTVSNFVQLADGTKTWYEGSTGKKMVSKRFYDGLIFHRIIPGFVIQGGDPKGNGSGGPGFTIQDELYPNIDFDKPGMVAMANTGRPNSGGSQFFITTDRLAGRLGKTYTIFGEVTEGMDAVLAISKSAKDASDKPLKEIKIIKVTVIKRP